jgi:hypothetical protein
MSHFPSNEVRHLLNNTITHKICCSCYWHLHFALMHLGTPLGRCCCSKWDAVFLLRVQHPHNHEAVITYRIMRTEICRECQGIQPLRRIHVLQKPTHTWFSNCHLQIFRYCVHEVFCALTCPVHENELSFSCTVGSQLPSPPLVDTFGTAGPGWYFPLIDHPQYFLPVYKQGLCSSFILLSWM